MGTGRVNEELIRKMSSVMDYRGPDDEGIYLRTKKEAQSSRLKVGLGHRRLSIIDLSRAGRQPISNEDKTVWMVFNGKLDSCSSGQARLQ